MIVKTKLFVVRDDQSLEIDGCNNFQASFDISAIGGTLKFDIPYVTPEVPTYSNSLGGFTIDRLKKFDFVFLYYYDSEEVIENDVEDPKRWKQIFNGYIENVNLRKSKESITYAITCNSMLALTNYYFMNVTPRGENINLVPYVILQSANLQVGPYNLYPTWSPQNFFPPELLDIQIEPIFGQLQFAGFRGVKNCKDAIVDFKTKYGLIFTENMDGVIQVTALTNYISSAEEYRFLYKDEIIPPKERTSNFIESALKSRPVKMALDLFLRKPFSVDEDRLERGKAINDWLKKNIPKIRLGFAKIYDRISPPASTIRWEDGKPIAEMQPTVYENVANDLFNKGFIELSESADFTRGRRINVLRFDVENNIFNLDYPDITTEYDGVVVVGLTTTGKAIDLTSIAMKDIQPQIDSGAYALNMLYLYRRDINSEFELNKIAREELYKLKQENKIKFDTIFSPGYRIGMTFTINDNDRYSGSEIFICTNISYTISKNDVVCTIEGSTSFLSLLPERAVTSDVMVLDVINLDLQDKITNIDWQNDWGV